MGDIRLSPGRIFGATAVVLVSAALATPAHQASAQAASQPQLKASRVEGVLARPAGQYKVNNSSSSVSTEITWNKCEKADDCMLAFDYLVDSERTYDQLRVWFDSEATPRFSISGYKTGHKRIKGIAPGTHTVRFEYAKDVSVSTGADMAWVDNVVAYDTAGRRHHSFCNDVWSIPTPPYGWTGAGRAGGWAVIEPMTHRGAERPREQFHKPSSSSFMSRTILLPDGISGKIAFEYFVDSEPKDALRLMVNGTLKWKESGREKRGRAEVPLPPGASQVRFVYEKDGADDDGLDLASVDEVKLLDRGRTIVLSNFTGLAPYSTRLGGWTTGGSGANYKWRAREKAPHITRLDPQLTGPKPVLDGALTRPAEQDDSPSTNPAGGEYPSSASVAPLPRYVERPPIPPDYAVVEPESSHLMLAADSVNRALYIVLTRKSATSTKGKERGTLRLYFDAKRRHSLAGLGCAASPSLPRNEDRRLDLSYEIPSGDAPAIINAVHWKGTCSTSAPWEKASASEAWGFEGYAGEDGAERLVVLEMRVILKPGDPDGQSDPFNSGTFGLGIDSWTPFAPGRGVRPANPATEHFPYLSGQAPDSDDVLTWETVILGPDVLADAPIDGCCRPGKAP